MANCLWASVLYSGVGIIAATLIARQNRHFCTRGIRNWNQRAPVLDQALIHGNHFSPSWSLPEQNIKFETRKWWEPDHPKHCLIVRIEGNIGSGKSTLLIGFKKMGRNVYQEPVRQMEDSPARLL